jgi:hypothetical protein
VERLRFLGRQIAEGHQVQKPVVEARDRAKVCLTQLGCTPNHGLEHRLHLRGRPADDFQHLGGCRLPLQGLGELAPVLFELLFQIGTWLAHPANARSHLRSGRTKLATMCSVLRAFARQGHLVGTLTGPLPVGPSQGSSLSILTEPRDEVAAR